MKDEIRLGEIITDDNQRRDAIHVAIVPAVSVHDLPSGCKVGLDHPDRETGDVVSVLPYGPFEGYTMNDVGIVDPFIVGTVPAGSRFWLMLTPGTIVGMRHHWIHPEIDKQTVAGQKEASRQWLAAFAEGAGLGLNRLIEIVEDYCETGDPWVEQGTEYARDAYSECNKEDFWRHIQAYTGLEKPKDDQAWYSPFSCSC